MEYVTQKLRFFTHIFVTRTNENKKEREVSRYEAYFEYIYKVLSWENNTLTLVVFLVLNFIFWLIVQWQLKFFGIIFFVILSAFLLDNSFQVRECTVYRGQYSEAVDEVCSFLYDIILNLKALRKESPSSFCIGMSLIFLFMSFIARSISGYILLYVTLLGIFFLPLGFKYLPEEYVSVIKQTLKSIDSSKGVLAEEELIPFISNKDFSRKDNDLDSLLTDKTADSATNSLVSGISAMPSYLDIAESRDGIEEDDLIPKSINHAGVSYTPGELSSDSDSDHREIHFDSAHFNGDSSSEEENQLGKGLQFSDTSDAPQKGRAAPEVGFSGLLSNFATVGGALVANVLKSAVASAPIERKNSSSDSEFEVINTDEIDN